MFPQVCSMCLYVVVSKSDMSRKKGGDEGLLKVTRNIYYIALFFQKRKKNFSLRKGPVGVNKVSRQESRRCLVVLFLCPSRSVLKTRRNGDISMLFMYKAEENHEISNVSFNTTRPTGGKNQPSIFNVDSKRSNASSLMLMMRAPGAFYLHCSNPCYIYT
jgi:hypothetical protein